LKSVVKTKKKSYAIQKIEYRKTAKMAGRNLEKIVGKLHKRHVGFAAGRGG
jgi:hypothetical protein